MSPFEQLIIKMLVGLAGAVAAVKGAVWGLKTALSYVEAKLDDLKADLKEDIKTLKADLQADISRLERKQEKYNNLQERVAKVEASASSAHKRISDLRHEHYTD